MKRVMKLVTESALKLVQPKVMRIEDKGSDHAPRVREILLTSSIRNVWRTLRRICILILWLKGLRIRGQVVQ